MRWHHKAKWKYQQLSARSLPTSQRDQRPPCNGKEQKPQTRGGTILDPRSVRMCPSRMVVLLPRWDAAQLYANSINEAVEPMIEKSHRYEIKTALIMKHSCLIFRIHACTPCNHPFQAFASPQCWASIWRNSRLLAQCCRYRTSCFAFNPLATMTWDKRATGERIAAHASTPSFNSSCAIFTRCEG